MTGITVTAFPFAVQYGTIEVPEGLTEEQKQEYIKEHWDDINFGEPDLDYAGTDFEFE